MKRNSLEYIKELKSDAQNPVRRNQVLNWIDKVQNEFHLSINKTSCRKWHKWLNQGEDPFPCACHSRNEDCIFIEAFFKLSKTAQIFSEQHLHEKAMAQYKSIMHNQHAIFEWVNSYEELGNKLLYLESVIVIAVQNYPHRVLKIHLEINDNPHTWGFMEIFSANYYSKDYESH